MGIISSGTFLKTLLIGTATAAALLVTWPAINAKSPAKCRAFHFVPSRPSVSAVVTRGLLPDRLQHHEALLEALHHQKFYHCQTDTEHPVNHQ